MLLQGLARPFIGQNRYIFVIFRLAVVDQEEALSVVKGEIVVVRSSAKLGAMKVAFPVVLANAVQNVGRSLLAVAAGD